MRGARAASASRCAARRASRTAAASRFLVHPLGLVGVDVRAVVAVAGNAVKFVAGLLDGIDVHHHRRKIAQVVEQLMTHLHGDGVAFSDRVPRSDGNAQVGVQAMTEPARAHVGHPFDALRTARRFA